MGSLIAGAAVIETLFNIPGMGQLVVNAVLKRDYPLIQGLVLVISLSYITLLTLLLIYYTRRGRSENPYHRENLHRKDW